MDTKEAAKFTGVPEFVLIRMRDRNNKSYKNGPPFQRKLTGGEIKYEYPKNELLQWMQMKRCVITALDAALIMGITREQMLKFSGLKGFDIRDKKLVGRLIIDNRRNCYIWLPKRMQDFRNLSMLLGQIATKMPRKKVSK